MFQFSYQNALKIWNQLSIVSNPIASLFLYDPGKFHRPISTTVNLGFLIRHIIAVLQFSD